MRVGQRLVLAVTPGVVGVMAVAALAYWGERGRQVPLLLLTIVALVTILSLCFAWVTTRDIARRIERLSVLADARGGRGRPYQASLVVALARDAIARLSGGGKARADELDAVEQLIARADGEFARLAEKEHEAASRLAEARTETARLLHDVGDRIAKQLDEVRLPLHVLLDAPFGELNENQEELVGVARAAADDASAEAHRLREIGRLELAAGARHDRLSPAELLRSLEPTIAAEGRRARVHVTLDLAPALPAVVGDPARLQEAVREVLARVVRTADSESSVCISARAAAGHVEVRTAPVRAMPADEFLAERRLLEALGARMQIQEGVLEILLPRWR